MNVFAPALLALGLSATLAHAQSAAEDVLNTALLLGPARLEQGTVLTLFGQSGTADYVAELTGNACDIGQTQCETVRFQAITFSANTDGAANAWAATGQAGELTVDPAGVLILSMEASLINGAQPAFTSWQNALSAFQAQFGG